MKNLLPLLFSVLTLSVFAQDGTKDLSFGTNGISTIVVGTGSSERLHVMEVLPDGKTLYMHTDVENNVEWTPMLTRLDTDGSLDASFGTGGTYYFTNEVNSGFTLYAITIDAQNRPIVVMVADNETLVKVYRLLADGSGLDVSFDSDGSASIDFGITTTDFYSRQVTVRPNGKILVTGSLFNGDVAAAQLNSNGSTDSGFGIGGKVVHDIPDASIGVGEVTLQADGKILLCGDADLIWGTPMAIIRLTSIGGIDNTFDDDGVKYRLIGSGGSFANQIHSYSDGKIIVSGFSDGGGTLAAFNEDGSGYDMFGTSDIKTLTLTGGATGVFSDMIVQSDGKILTTGIYTASGGATDKPFWVVRFNADGTLDPSFSDDGLAWEYSSTYDIQCHQMGLTPDGGVIVSAKSHTQSAWKIAFLKLNNSITVSIAESNTVDFNIYPNPTAEELILNLSQLAGNSATVRIVDVSGREVLNTSELTGGNITLDVTSLVTGTYFGTVTSGSESGSFQFVKN